MERDELYAKYIGVKNINAVLKQQNADLVVALEKSSALINDFVIRLRHESWWGGSNLARKTGDVILANAEALAQVGE